MTKRLGLFTRLLDPSPGTAAARVYADAAEQFMVAERLGYDIGWVAQHHFDPEEGGLPSPFVFLAGVAARTERIRLGTGIVTVALEDPVRVAEDAAVLDTLSGGRLELGLGSGGSTGSFAIFGRDAAARSEIYPAAVTRVLDALAGRPLDADGTRLHPDGTRLLRDIWQATFSPAGGARIGAAGSGLLLSRHQPRTADAPLATLAQIQQPVVDAYTAALPAGVRPARGAGRHERTPRAGARQGRSAPVRRLPAPRRTAGARRHARDAGRPRRRCGGCAPGRTRRPCRHP
jgi:alkanesulfonate monooxygenase SsuD/methylene tetrahydromethanopterin reductase-like flavin-dependent oxidoreductase (luciferase family)